MFVSAGMSHPDVDGMTSQAVRTKIRYEKTKNVTRLNLGKGFYAYTNFLWGPEVATDASRSRSYTGGGLSAVTAMSTPTHPRSRLEP